MTDLAQGFDARLNALEGEIERLSRRARLFDLAPEATLLTDADGVIVEANAAAAGLLGEPADALRGRALGLYIPLEQLRVFHARLHVARAAKGARWEGSLRRLAGDVKAEITMSVIRHGAGPVTLLWALRQP